MPAPFQISIEAAEAYEDQFVPALFAEWAPELVDLADVRPAQSVLDVGCGTGIVARTAADRLDGSGRVVGLDQLEAMVTVAGRLRPDLEWYVGDAHDLPFEDGTFDRVLSQAALMFMDAPQKALAEMARVVTNDGTVAIQVVGRLQESPGLYPFAQAVERHAGRDSVELWATYFRLGDPDQLKALVESAGLEITATRIHVAKVRVPSIDAYVAAEVESTPLGDQISDAVYDRIRADANRDLAPFITEQGVALPIEGHLLAARPAG